ncbi:2TM domain-containing protein [Flavobacterium franklandianum]|uniref:2TM domain-containing protein n=1 Tax=Flavobacterium franklandianum TaxID=2594430 RepID=A0A553C7D5_9FLAO|nr:2TM domain-containing protein [Flavobacterium franklandianum]TRX16415.1 2TM domain-containing protein [Flavobacterium franklandianum]
MENNYQEEDERYFKARKRFDKIKAFYGHLIIYLSIIPVVILFNLEYDSDFQWFWYSVIGGGIPLLMHALKVFAFNANWEARKVQEILDKEDNN